MFDSDLSLETPGAQVRHVRCCAVVAENPPSHTSPCMSIFLQPTSPFVSPPGIAAGLPLPEGTPLVVVADDWGRHVSTVQHVIRQLLPLHPIVWVNSFGHRAPRLTGYDLRRALAKVRGMARPVVIEAVVEGELRPDAVVNPRALPWHGMSLVRRVNGLSIAHDVRRALARVAPGRRSVLVTNTPTACDLVGRLDELAAVYYCIDDYAAMPGIAQRMMAAVEPRLLARVDGVVATARTLADTRRPRRGAAHYLPQGVNFDHFAKRQPLPNALAELPRPVVGFAGGISDCVDFDVVNAVARALPGASVALVGPQTTTAPLPPLAANVHLLGPQSYAELPAWVQGFDVGIVPYRDSPWTRAVDPLKLLEYLAAGIPVVATDLPEVRKYAQVVHIGASPASFVRAVEDALGGRGADLSERLAVARANTWAARATSLRTILGDIVQQRATVG
jgi:glycosyltransferase involved in cell wall biosynthesis